MLHRLKVIQGSIVSHTLHKVTYACRLYLLVMPIVLSKSHTVMTHVTPFDCCRLGLNCESCPTPFEGTLLELTCDLCPAKLPVHAGKATHLARLMSDQGTVIALDRTHAKAQQIR